MRDQGQTDLYGTSKAARVRQKHPPNMPQHHTPGGLRRGGMWMGFSLHSTRTRPPHKYLSLASPKRTSATSGQEHQKAHDTAQQPQKATHRVKTWAPWAKTGKSQPCG